MLQLCVLSAGLRLQGWTPWRAVSVYRFVVLDEKVGLTELFLLPDQKVVLDELKQERQVWFEGRHWKILRVLLRGLLVVL